MKIMVFIAVAEPEMAKEILFYPTWRACADAASKACGEEALIFENTDISTPEGLWDAVKAQPAADGVLYFFAPLPAITPETIKTLLSQPAGAAIDGMYGRTAFYVPVSAPIKEAASLKDIAEALSIVYPTDPAEALPAYVSELSLLTTLMRQRVNDALAESGVIMMDTSNVYVSPEAEIAPGAELLPGTMIKGKTKIAAGAVIGPNTILENVTVDEGATVNSTQAKDSSIGARAKVGPFTYIRPDCRIGADTRIGDFVELKNAHIGDKTNVSHLTYVGDSRVGRGVNFGCGTVTVNYDGMNKHVTEIGDNAFIGCNTNLVAPVRVGNGAFTAAGTTVTHDVPDGALVIGRSRQEVREGWADKRYEDGKLKHKA